MGAKSSAMNHLPNPFWALCFMVLGCLLLFAVLVKLNANTTTVMLGVLMAIVTAGSNLISGAFGYINGHKDGVASVTTPNATLSVGTTQPSPSAPTQGGDVESATSTSTASVDRLPSGN